MQTNKPLFSRQRIDGKVFEFLAFELANKHDHHGKVGSFGEFLGIQFHANKQALYFQDRGFMVKWVLRLLIQFHEIKQAHLFSVLFCFFFCYLGLLV